MNVAVLVKATLEDQKRALAIDVYDQYVIQEALKIKSKTQGEVSIIILGSEGFEGALYQTLVRDADNAVYFCRDQGELHNHGTIMGLVSLIRDSSYNLLLVGYHRDDDGLVKLATGLAEKLGLPQVHMVSKIEIAGGDILVQQRVNGKSAVVRITPPAFLAMEV